MVVESHTKHAGGGPLYWAQLSEWLLQQGHEVTILSGIPKEAEYASPNTIGLIPVRSDLRNRSLSTLSSRYFFRRRLVPAVRAFVRQWQPDIIHTVPPVASEAALRAGEEFHIPVVISILSHVESQWTRIEGGRLRSWIFRRLESQAIHRPFSRIICLTRHSERVLLAEGAPIERVVYIPHAVDVQRFNPHVTPQFREALDLLDETFVLGYAGAISQDKGIEQLLRAINQLSKRVKLHLLIAGTKPPRGRWRNRIESIGLQNVTFLGALDHEEMPGFMASLDLYAIPSYTETLPTTLLEALATGTPVLATAVGGVTEFLQNQFGIVLAAPQANLIVKTLKEWTDRRSELKKMGFAGQQFVAEHHSWERSGKLTEGVYQKCLRNL